MTTSPTDQSSTTVKAKLKKKEGRMDSANGDDSCTTDEPRKNLPTCYRASYVKLSLAQPTPLYVLREQRPGTRRPSGLVKSLHNDNVVLTQECCCRCCVTTTTPVTTSNFDEDVDGVRDVGRERPRFFP